MQEVRAAPAAYGIFEVWCIEEIRAIGTELQTEALGELEGAEQAEVKVHAARPI